MPMHGNKPLSPPWQPEHPAGRWHPTHIGTPGPSTAGDTPRSPQSHTTGHPRDAAAPPNASAGQDVAFSHFHRMPPCLFPAGLGSKGQGPSEDHPTPPGLTSCHQWTMGQMESAARPTTWLSKSRHLCCPKPRIPPLHLPWASLSAPKTCCRRGALPTRWPSWPASTTSHPLWWPGDRRSTATCPRGMSYHQSPAPQGITGTPGAASGLHRADPCSVL